jgi:flagellar biosynthesis/type III secretory pathway chaperone
MHGIIKWGYTMASLMEELIDVLGKEVEEYNVLLNLSHEKTSIIVNGNTERLEEVTEMEQEVMSRVRNFEKKRTRIMQDISNVTNRPLESLKLSDMIGFLENRPEERQKLETIQTDLQKVLGEFKETNAQNAVLIQQAIEMVEFDLTLFRSMRQAPETANYDKNAYNTGSLLGGGGFDSSR